MVFTSVFPHPGQPNVGLFVRERMFRAGQLVPLTVVAPVPWFPLQGLIRRWRPHFRPEAPAVEVQEGFEVLHPRFFCVPGVFKSLDGLLMALSCFPTMVRLKRRFGFNLIDAHFAYPDGYAATLLGKWLGVPVTVTLRGTETRLSRSLLFRSLIRSALKRATRIFAVADSLRRHAVSLGIDPARVRVVGNGIDTEKFRCLEQRSARRRLGLPSDVPVLVSVGGLVERKGFHRVIECLPELKKTFPDLCYMVVGGASAEGDWEPRLRRQVADLGLDESVLFLGAQPPEALSTILSAADVFVLATRYEGWANVFLEAMACGLPVVSTQVGGNAEVVCRPELGTLVPFGDSPELCRAMADALQKKWDRGEIVAYAQENSWDSRVAAVVEEFRLVAGTSGKQGMSPVDREAGATR